MATFTNQAQISYNGITRSSNITVGEIQDLLTMTKTAVGDTYTVGSDITYVVNIVNTGSTNYTGLQLTDDLGATLFNGSTVYPLAYKDGSVRYFVNGTLQTAPEVTATEPLTIAGINVPAEGNVTIIYEAVITSFAPLDTEGSVTNNVELETPQGRQTDCQALVSLTASATITPETEPDLTVSKSLAPTTVTENGQITYTFVIANSGNTAATAADNVTLTDTFNPVLSGLTATLDGEPLSLGTDYTYDTASGLFSTLAGVITVPAAVYEQNPDTGEYTTTPGTVTLVVKGSI